MVDVPILLATTSWIFGFSILFSWTLMLYRYLNLNNSGSTFGRPTWLPPKHPARNWRYRFRDWACLRWPWCARFTILPLCCRRSSAGITSWRNPTIPCAFAIRAPPIGSKRPWPGRRTPPTRRSQKYQIQSWTCLKFGPISCGSRQLWDTQHMLPPCRF